MGTYINDEKEVVNAIAEALNNIEGDFTQETLFNSLEKCKEYPYVCDKIINDKKWKKCLDV